MSYEERFERAVIEPNGPPGRPFVWASDARSLVRDMDAALAIAEADCAAMREASQGALDQLERPDELSQAVTDALRYALTRPTGQSILDELSAARKALKRIWDEDCENLSDTVNDLRMIAATAYDAARKANTGAK